MGSPDQTISQHVQGHHRRCPRGLRRCRQRLLLQLTSQLHTRRRSSHPSLSLMSTESLMTTARPTSRRPRPRMPTVLSPEASPSLSPTAESRPQSTPLTTSTDSLLMSPTREPQSTHQSQLRDTDTSPPLLTRLPQPQLTTPKSFVGVTRLNYLFIY